MVSSKVTLFFFLLFSSFNVSSNSPTNIAFGHVKGIKLYSVGSNNQSFKIIFSEDSTNQNVEGCELVAYINSASHSEGMMNRMLTLATTAYVSGKKLRAYSHNGTCEVTFLALQESYF